MKSAKLADIRKRNSQRRAQAMRTARRVNPDFIPGMRTSDRLRKNPYKQQILDEMKEIEDELQHK
ncbi:hypothetical protein [Lacicoccus alkaliphilus]|uniref:Uncharacterized protein n=1 Tax=Lacicoccus alkaliphilus DSM 16010 TaxID=1123231 RepID=A0A1M7IRL9_9BACL|nr:hypothetical protein [Salinicoccus alkaliphilus]SHM43263.1 hypothetical protein SAMN02745189_02136 [Salinicoccus alkaliphilus DSM 16010]